MKRLNLLVVAAQFVDDVAVSGEIKDQDDALVVADGNDVRRVRRAGDGGDGIGFVRLFRIEKWRELFALSLDVIPSEEAASFVADDDVVVAEGR